MVDTVEVEFFTGPFSLSGQIDYPNDTDTAPAIMIVPGAPQHDRYGNVRGYSAYNGYLQTLADTILEMGYAVFRWDKGGTGKSSSGLSAPLNMISAYREMTNLPRIDRNRIGILAIGGGSAHIYRKWSELQDIQKIHQLILMSTGVNDLKLEDIEVPICLLTGSGRVARNERVLKNFSNTKGHRSLFYNVEEASEQLLDQRGGKVNMFNDKNAQWHPEILNRLQAWLSLIKS